MEMTPYNIWGRCSASPRCTRRPFFIWI